MPATSPPLDEEKEHEDQAYLWVITPTTAEEPATASATRLAQSLKFALPGRVHTSTETGKPLIAWLEVLERKAPLTLSNAYILAAPNIGYIAAPRGHYDTRGLSPQQLAAVITGFLNLVTAEARSVAVAAFRADFHT